MTPESAFIADILACPNDHVAALVYSDWLIEQGRESEALFVRFCTWGSGLSPHRTRQGGLAWWDSIQERWLGRLAVGKTWEVRAWSWTPGQQDTWQVSADAG